MLKKFGILIIISISLFMVSWLIHPRHNREIKTVVTGKKLERFPFVYDIRYDAGDSVYVAEFADGVTYSANTDNLEDFIIHSTVLDSIHHSELQKSLIAYYNHPIPKYVR